MRTMLAATWAFIRGEEGMSVVDYALMLLFILAATIAGISIVGSQISAFFEAVSTSI